MDFNAWVLGVTAVANMLKAMIDGRKAGLDFEEAKKNALSAKDRGNFSQDLSNTSEFIINEELLEAYLEDIKNAETRLVKTINDPRYTPAEREKEELVATKSICTHVSKIKQYNGGKIPAGNLDRIWESYGCESTN